MTITLAACAPAPASPPTSTSATPTSTPTTAATSPTPTTTPTPPAKPALWTSGNQDGALAAAQYFMDLYNYVIATGDLTEWRALSARDCTFCANVEDGVQGLYAEGGRFGGGDLTTSAGRLEIFDDELHLHTIRFGYATTEMRRIDAAGSVVRTTPAEAGWILVDVGFDGDSWELVGATTGGHA